MARWINRKDFSVPITNRSFRLVCTHDEMPQVEALLQAQGFSFIKERLLPFARRLTREPFPLGRSLAAFFGLVYIQDRSSMLPPVALSAEPASTVLDMCASPGSKTGLNAQLVGPQGTVLGNEPGRPRLATLRRNMQSLNLLNVCTCCHDGTTIPLPSQEEGGGFDFIQLDPPCSGWGTVDKNPKVLELWKDNKIDSLVTLQRALLRKAATLLRPGGRLVFSTCTTNVDENERQVMFARDELGLLPVRMEPPQGVRLEEPLCGIDGVWRLDATDEGQGFFVAAFTKDASISPPIPDVHVTPPSFEDVPSGILAEAGIDPDRLPQGKVGIFGNVAMFLPEKALRAFPADLRWQGFPLGKVTGGRIVPSPRLRSKGLSPRLELDDIPPISALVSGQSIRTDLKGTFAELTWNGLTLGRVRLKNGRALWSEK